MVQTDRMKELYAASVLLSEVADTLYEVGTYKASGEVKRLSDEVYTTWSSLLVPPAP